MWNSKIDNFVHFEAMQKRVSELASKQQMMLPNPSIQQRVTRLSISNSTKNWKIDDSENEKSEIEEFNMKDLTNEGIEIENFEIVDYEIQDFVIRKNNPTNPLQNPNFMQQIQVSIKNAI